MSKKICFMDIKVNDPCHGTDHEVYKKNLFAFSRLVSISYDYGTTISDKFNSTLKNTHHATERCANFNDKSLISDKNSKDIEVIIYDIKKILNDTEILVIYNTHHQLRCLISEFIKYNINFNLKNIVIIDLQSFNNDYKCSSVKKLAKKLNISNDSIANDNIELIKNTFFKLYNNLKTL